MIPSNPPDSISFRPQNFSVGGSCDRNCGCASAADLAHTPPPDTWIQRATVRINRTWTLPL